MSKWIPERAAALIRDFGLAGGSLVLGCDEITRPTWKEPWRVERAPSPKIGRETCRMVLHTSLEV